MSEHLPGSILLYGGDANPCAAARLLVAEGFCLRTAHSPSEIREAAGCEPPDLLLFDGSASPDGVAAAVEALREAVGSRFVPVLGVEIPAGWASGSAPALHDLADDLLPTGTAPDRLLHRVRALMRLTGRLKGMGADLQRLTQVGIALSAEHNLARLLERIVDEACAITNADAGTVYTVDNEAGVLRFQVAVNHSLGTRMGGETGAPVTLPPVPLTPSHASANVALTGKIVNIPDVYEAEGFDFTGTRQYDRITGYRSRSMLAVPIRNHEDEVILVLQLFNAVDPATGQVGPFQPSSVGPTRALASQAGVALTNATLINDLQALLEGLIQVMATAIDEKSAYTAGHVRRVTRLAVLLAEAVNGCAEAEFEGRRFTRAELEELRIAGLLHDIGKIVVPEHVVDKATKLERVYDRIAEVRTRFSAIRLSLHNAALREKLKLAQAPGSPTSVEAVDLRLQERLAELDEDLAFIESVNNGGEFMAPERLERLQSIAERTYFDDTGNEHPYLTECEVRNLSIPRGTLLPEELDIIRGHASVSIRLLSQIPFARKLKNVPTIAGEHHETLNGTGYPLKKTAEQLGLQSRILAVADIFDALTASDRPYKRAYSAERAYEILRDEASRGRLDGRLVEAFIRAECHRRLQEEIAAGNFDPFAGNSPPPPPTA
jgi:HD-GYP domain-containing protein (c-di-GMP phosphodiesterase class II)